MASKADVFELMKGFAAAGSAACIAETVTIPIDTAKVRLQLQGGLAVAGKQTGAYSGTVDCIRRICVDEGAGALFKGLAPGLLRQILFASLRIGLYEPVRNLFASGPAADTSIFTKIAAGLTTGTIGIAVANPVDLLKIRLQAEGRLAKGIPRRYNGIADAFIKVFRAEGIAGFWTGVMPNIARNATISAAELASYDQLKQTALSSGYLSDNASTHIICAFGAGFIATIIGSPVDVLKTRIMNAEAGVYSGAIDCIIKTVQHEGPLAFYKGFIPNFSRIGSWNVVMFLSLEQIKKLILTPS